MNIYQYFSEFPYVITKNNTIIEENNFSDLKKYFDINSQYNEIIKINNILYNVYKFNYEENTIFVFIDVSNISSSLEGNFEKVLTIMPKIGIPIIDKQHYQMCNIIKCIEQDSLSLLTNINDITLNFFNLLNLTKEHFSLEESLFEKSLDKEYKKTHAAEHNLLLNQLELFIGQLSISNIRKIIQFLSSWMLKHINKYDIELSNKI